MPKSEAEPVSIYKDVVSGSATKAPHLREGTFGRRASSQGNTSRLAAADRKLALPWSSWARYRAESVRRRFGIMRKRLAPCWSNWRHLGARASSLGLVTTLSLRSLTLAHIVFLLLGTCEDRPCSGDDVAIGQGATLRGSFSVSGVCASGFVLAWLKVCRHRRSCPACVAQDSTRASAGMRCHMFRCA